MKRTHKPSTLEPLAPRMTGQALATWLLMSPDSLRGIMAPLGIGTGSEGGGYDVRQAVSAIVAHYRDMSEKVARQTEGDRARKMRAEADDAEVMAAQRIGLLVSRDEMRRLLEGLLVKFREDIRAIPWATLEQKRAICDLVAKMVLPAPGEEGE